MNKKLPFEEAFERQMNNLQPQHEDESWQKMKQLLDEKDKRKPVAFFKNYKAIVILILLLLSGVWFFKQEKNTRQEQPVTKAEKATTPHQKSNTNKSSKIPTPVIAIQEKTTGNSKVLQVNNQGNSLAEMHSVASNPEKDTQVKTFIRTNKTVNSLSNKSKIKTPGSELKDVPRSNQTNTTKGEVADIRKSAAQNRNNAVSLPETLPVSIQQKIENDSLSSIEKTNGKTEIDKVKENKAAKENTVLKDAAVTKKTPFKASTTYILSAGVGVQQQIPLAGQKTVAYGYNGTTSTISDYIPSVYIRFEKDQKWFLQGEFIYASPQLLKAFAYDKQTHANNNTSTITTTRFRLKKTYYNEVPLSFNYYIRPNWYAGVGGVYSSFHGAIAEKEILTNNVLTLAQTVSKQIVPIAGYTDSFLYKTHTYLLLQTGYNLGRLSAGLRYTRDIQPYIKYTLPDGTINNEKSWSLEFILRFRLFKAARF